MFWILHLVDPATDTVLVRTATQLEARHAPTGALRWTADLGRPVAIVGDTVYAATTTPGAYSLVALDLATGEPTGQWPVNVRDDAVVSRTARAGRTDCLRWSAPPNVYRCGVACCGGMCQDPAFDEVLLLGPDGAVERRPPSQPLPGACRTLAAPAAEPTAAPTTPAWTVTQGPYEGTGYTVRASDAAGRTLWTALATRHERPQTPPPANPSVPPLPAAP